MTDAELDAELELRRIPPAEGTEFPWFVILDPRRIRLFAAGQRVRRRADQAHRIMLVAEGTLTVVITGKKERSWGFLTPDGWVPWRRYLGVS